MNKVGKFAVGAFALVATSAMCARGATYYWKATSASEPASASLWTALSNWSTESESGADATELPGTSDDIYDKGNGVWRSFDLENGEWSISGWKSAYSDDWNRHNWRFQNGTLHWTGSWATHSDTVYLENGASFIFDVGSAYLASDNHGATDEWRVKSGASLSMLGDLRIYKIDIEVADGGTMTFNPSNLRFWNSTAQQSYLKNYGTLDIPNGYTFTIGSDKGASFSLQQLAGTLTLGGPLSKNGMAGTYNATFSGGTIHVTGNVSFDLTSVTIPVGAFLTLEIDENASIDLSTVSYGVGASVTKTGSGDYPFANGDPLPDTFTVNAGAVVLSTPGSYDISGISFGGGGQVKIGAAGIILTDWDPSLATSGGFVAAIASPVNGSTLFTCQDASILELARTGLNATLPDGFAVTVSGNSLVVSSSYVFNSTTVTDLNNPAGWVGGSVPVGKVVTIMGAGVAPTSTALPAFAGMTIMDGASLTIANGGTLPAVTLSDSASLTLSSGDFTLAGALSSQPSGGNVPAIAIASGATLSVPGGTTFTDCRMTVGGTLGVSSSGNLNLGYAIAGETASFGLSVTGTISNMLGHVNFFCPASGGTVVPLGDIVFTGATLVTATACGYNFGVNNPNSTLVDFTFDNTVLDYPDGGTYAIAGGSVLTFKNGGSLNHNHNQSTAAQCILNVTGLSRIVLLEGTSSKFGMSANNGSAGNGYISFAPDVDGHNSLTISNACWETHHADGNSKAVVEVFGNSAHPLSAPQSWNRKRPFYHTKSVHLNEGAVLAITNNVDSSSLDFNETYTGEGSLFFSTSRSTTRTFNFGSTASTATGTLAADSAKNTALVIATNATWGGTVVWNGKASISHSSAADAMTFGGIDLAADFNIRIWANDGSCDHYTLTGAGFVDNGGRLTITISDGGEPAPDASFTLARVPAGSFVPPVQGTSWIITTQAVDGDDAVVDLVISPAVSDCVFEFDGTADFCSALGWATGSVPTNQDVKVIGATTVATITDAAAFPAFTSIAVRNGATLKVLANVTLPPLTIDSTSKVVFGDGTAAVSTTLDASLTTIADANVSPVALPVIEVATNATLTVSAGMKFKNVDFRLYGTVRREGTDALAPTFGYAENGETSYIAFTADGGTFDFHANNNDREYGAVFLVRPASGGMVIPLGTITLRNAVRNVTGWADFGSWEFGVNNPTNIPFEVLVDGTHIDVSGDFYASGAAHLTLVNGSFIRRNDSCLGHWYPMAIQYSATITVGEGCYIDFTTNDGQFGVDSQVAVDAVTVVSGGVYSVSQNSSGWGRGVFVSDGGILGVTKKSSRDHADLLCGFGSARLDDDLFIASLNIGTGSIDWDRHVKMSNIPFAGAGDVTITNGVPEYPFTVTMVNGANTATGTIRVAKAGGDADTTLYFADGANWAGTVVAGNVSLTNLTDGASAATATFGTLDLAAEFSLRVWKTGDVVTTNDVLKVDSYTGTSRIAIVEVGESLVPGDKFVIGKVKSTGALPKVGKHFTVRKGEPDGDDYCDVLVKYSVGFQLIVR